MSTCVRLYECVCALVNCFEPGHLLQVMLIFVVLASTLVFYWDWCDNIIPFVLVYVAFALMAIGVIMFLTGHHPVLWIFWFIFGDHRRVSSCVQLNRKALIIEIHHPHPGCCRHHHCCCYGHHRRCHHHHLSLNCEGHWGTINDFTTSFPVSYTHLTLPTTAEV